MASTSGNQGEELTKGMVSIVEYMLKMRDREALIDKAVDRTVSLCNGHLKYGHIIYLVLH